jgi:hypothetical protein
MLDDNELIKELANEGYAVLKRNESLHRREFVDLISMKVGENYAHSHGLLLSDHNGSDCINRKILKYFRKMYGDEFKYSSFQKIWIKK